MAAIAAAVSAFFAFKTIQISQQTLNPNVILYIEENGNGNFYFTIKNIGNSEARNIEILGDLPQSGDFIGNFNNHILKEGIVMLPPNHSRSILMGYKHMAGSTIDEVNVVMTVKYKNSKGDNFKEDFKLIGKEFAENYIVNNGNIGIVKKLEKIENKVDDGLKLIARTIRDKK